MNKKAKSKGFIWIIVILGIAVVAGMYYQKNAPDGYPTFTFGGSQTIYRSCDYVLENTYFGAQPGECVYQGADLASKPNPTTNLWYIESAVERSRPCSLSWACPTGEQVMCDIVVTRNMADLLACTGAKSSVGHLTCDAGNLDMWRGANFCTYDGQIQIPSSCSYSSGSNNDCIDITSTTHAVCLPNGKYSGVLSGQCASSNCNGVVCADGTCQVSSCAGHTSTNGTIDKCSIGSTWNETTGKCEFDMTIVYIGGAVVGLVLLLSLLKK